MIDEEKEPLEEESHATYLEDNKCEGIQTVAERPYKNKKIKDIELGDFIQKKQKNKVKSDSNEKPINTKNIVEGNELDSAVVQFLTKIKKKQDQTWKVSENKARAHRHLVCGFHETLKHLCLDNIKAIFIAQNIDELLIQGSVSSLYHSVRERCCSEKVPFIICSTKKNLAKAIKKHPYVGCVGVLRYDGYDIDFENIIKLWKGSETSIAYHLDQLSLFP